jgi:hypothetical protein
VPVHAYAESASIELRGSKATGTTLTVLGKNRLDALLTVGEDGVA